MCITLAEPFVSITPASSIQMLITVDRASYFAYELRKKTYLVAYELRKKTYLVLEKLSEIYNDLEAFQRACLVGRSILKGINLQFNTNYLPGIVTVLDSAESFDFFGFCRLPRAYLYPYTADRLDEFDILKQLKPILCSHFKNATPENESPQRDLNIENYAKERLNELLEKMAEEDIVFRTEKEVRLFIAAWLNKHPFKEGYAPIKLDEPEKLKIILKDISLLDRAISACFDWVDIACIPSFLSGWEIIDLSPYANAIGKIPVLKWAAKYTLDDWIWCVLAFGYGLQIIAAVLSLLNGNLSPEERKDALWTIAQSVAECFYSLSILSRLTAATINALALVAKSLGLAAFLAASKQKFFPDDVNKP